MSTTPLNVHDGERSDTASRSVRFVIVLLCLLIGSLCLLFPSAAAEPTIDDVTIEDDESWIGLENDHELHVEASGIETTDAPATVSVELSGWSADALSADPTVDIGTPGVHVDGDVETDGTTVTFDINDTSEPMIDFEATIDLSFDHPLESSFDGTTYGATVDITDADGSADANTDVTIKRLSYSVDDTERFPPSTEFVYHGQVVTVDNLVSGSDYNLYEYDPDADPLGDPIESVSPDGTTTIDTSDDSIDPGWYIVHDGDDVVLADENAFQVRTQRLEATQIDGTVATVGDGAETSVALDSPLRSTPFDVNVTSDELEADELFEVFEGESNGDVERVDDSDSMIVIRDVEAGDEVPMTFDPVLEATYNFEYEVRDTNAGDTTEVGVEEREIDAQFGDDSYETAAGEIVEIDVSLENTDEAYLMIGGDKFSGDNALTNYFDILHVRASTTIRINTRLLGTNVPTEEVYATDDGQVTSYYHDPEHDGFDDVSFDGGADDLSSFRSDIGVGDLPRPLQPDRLRLVAGASGDVTVRDDGVPDFERPLARSNLVISDTEGFGNVTTYVAPRGSANEFEGEAGLGDLRGTLTERRTVAKGDRLVFEIEASGITGLVSWLDDRLGTEGVEIDRKTLSKLLEFPDGVVLDAEQTNPGPNERVTKLDINDAADGELYLVHEPIVQNGEQRSIERFYLVIDTRGTGPFDREIAPGDEYEFEFGYASTGETGWFGTVDHDGLDPNGAEPHFPYHDADTDNITETRLITVEERMVEYDRIDSRNRPVIRSSSSATLSGRTNLAPGTEATIQLIANDRPNPTRITIDDVQIEDDGSFDVTPDLSVLDPDEPIEAEFYVEQHLFEKRPAVVAPADGNLTDFTIIEHTEPATVETGENISTVSATIENVGYLPGRRSVEFIVDGERVEGRATELDESDAKTVAFEGRIDLDPGEYQYAISVEDAEATGRLLVKADDTDTRETDEPEPPGTSNSSDDASAETDTDDSEERTDDEIPDDEPEKPASGPFAVLVGGVGARHAIGGAAVVGGAHVLGYWS